MKQTKRLLLAVLCIVLVLASALAVVAACDETEPQPAPETGYSLTLSFDNTKGSVTATKPAEGTLYDSGEKITVTVTPAENFEVASFKVNGTDSQIPTGGGTYEFNITADTTVAVTFNAKQDTPPAPTTYEVKATANYAEGADLVLSAASVESGTTVTLTVTAHEGYVLRSVTVNGSAIEAAEGKYSFKVTANTEFAVTLAKIVEVTSTVDPADSGATVSVTPATHDGSYWSGDEITITVNNIPEGKQLDAIEVNGSELQAKEGAFTYTLTDADAHIVAFIGDLKMSGDLLAAFRGGVSFDITRTQDFDSIHIDDEVVDITTVFDDDLNAIYKVGYRGDVLVLNYLIAEGWDNGVIGNAAYAGLACTVMHNASGMMVFNPYRRTGTMDNLTMDDIGNPFDNFAAEDFVLVADGIWQLKNIARAENFLEDLTGYTDEIENIYIAVEDDAIQFVRVETPVQANTSGKTFHYVYDIAIGDASIDPQWLQDYPDAELNADQAQLQAAFDKAAAAQSYKASFTLESVYSPGSTSQFDVIVTPDAIWSNQVGGYATSNVYRRENGSANEYTLDEDNNLVRGDVAMHYQNYRQYTDDFAQFGEFPVAFFDKVDENVFGTIRVFDGYYLGLSTNASGLGAAYRLGDAAPLVPGYGAYRTYWMYSVHALEVTLDEQGNVSQISIGGMSYNVVVTFSQWNEAELPFKLPENADKGILPDKYLGEWYRDYNDPDGSPRAVQLLEIDGKVRGVLGTGQLYTTDKADTYQFKDSEGNDQGTFVFDGSKLTVTAPDGSKTNFYWCNWSHFIGTFYGEIAPGQDYLLDIRCDGIDLTVNGQKTSASDIYLAILSNGLNTINLLYITMEDGTEYIIGEEDTQYRAVALITNLDTFDGYVLGKLDSDWSDIANQYMYTAEDGTVYTITITDGEGFNDVITILTIGPDGYNFSTIKDAKYIWNVIPAEQLGTTSDYYFQRIEFYNNGLFSVIIPDGIFTSRGDTFIMYNNESMEAPIYLNSVEMIGDWSDSGYIGTWFGADEEGVQYEIEITAGHVYFTVDGQKAEAFVAFYDAETFYLLADDGYIYMLGQAISGNGVIYLFGSDSYSICALTAQKDVVFDSSYIGYWVADDFSVALTITDNKSIRLGIYDATDIVANEDGTVSFTWQEYRLTISVNAEGNVVLTDPEQDPEKALFEEPVELFRNPIWSDGEGHYTGIVGDGNVLHVDILATRIQFSGAYDWTIYPEDILYVQNLRQWMEGYYAYAYFIAFEHDGETYCLMSQYYTEDELAELYYFDVIALQRLKIFSSTEFYPQETLAVLVYDQLPLLNLSDFYGVWTYQSDAANLVVEIGPDKIVILGIDEEGYIYDSAQVTGFVGTYEDTLYVFEDPYGVLHLLGFNDEGVYYIIDPENARGFLLQRADLPSYDLQGTYASADGEYRLLLDYQGIMFYSAENEYGTPAENLQFINDATWTFDVNGSNYTLILGDEALRLFNLSSGEETLLYSCDWYMFIGNYDSGTELGLFDGKYALEITATGVVFIDEFGNRFDGEDISAGSMSGGGMAMIFHIGDDTYQLQQRSRSSDACVLWINGSTHYFMWRAVRLDVTDSWKSIFEDPFVYDNGYVRIELSSKGLALTLAFEEATVENLKVYSLNDYLLYQGEAYPYLLFTFTVDGTPCQIQLDSAGSYALFTQGNGEADRIYAEDFQADYSAFAGVWTGHRNNDDASFVVSVSDKGGVEVSIEGISSSVDVLYVGGSGYIALLIDGEEWWLRNNYGSLTLTDGDQVSMTLTRCTWEQYIGVYLSAEDAEVSVVLTVQGDRFIIQIGDGQPIVKDNWNYDIMAMPMPGGTQYMITVDGITYNVLFSDANHATITYKNGSESVSYSVARTGSSSQGGGSDVDLSGYVGAYVDSDSLYRLNIAGSGATLKVASSTSVEASSITKNDQGNIVMTFEVDGETYTVTQVGSGFSLTDPNGDATMLFED